VIRQGLGHAEVEDFQLRRELALLQDLLEKQVAGLDVAVNHAPNLAAIYLGAERVGKVQPFTSLQGQPNDLPKRQSPFFPHQLAQILPLEVLHHQVGLLALLAVIQNFDDAGMLSQKDADADLFGKAAAQIDLGVAPAQQQGRVQDLDRHLLVVVV
jgi:hypothetical protein